MIFVLLALVAWNVATQILAARREARLLDAVMTRTPGEYIALRKADAAPAKFPSRRSDEAAEPAVYPVGL